MLTRIAAAVGGIGVAFASIPFVKYFLPSERAKELGSPITVDVSTFREGETRAYVWRGQPILVTKRSPSELESLRLTDDRLLDTSDPDDWQPDYVNPIHRGLREDFLIVVGVCTHLGCVPANEIKRGQSLMGDWWPGGFTCPCHGSVYDYAGRVVRGPAPRNLRVPPYYFETPDTVVIGSSSRDV